MLQLKMDTPEFLAENNVCGQNLLRIVSIGNAIIAEILRLKNYIPHIYRLETKADQQKYSELILDFSYLKILEVQNKKIEDVSILQDLDEQIKENYIEIITRFYLTFKSIHQYAVDLKHFVEELNDGYYIQHTLETVLQDEEGKQLMCESLYLYGVMLLILDLYIPGIIRERILVSYYRYSTEKSFGDNNIDDICKLLRSTGFSNTKNTKRIANYPENYFRRFIFEQTFIDMIIGRLRSDDIYNQISVYPHPNHRSTALSQQAAMLFVCLFFSPDILNNQISLMREITDKFYSDNWIISIYMGITYNLIDAWDIYKAAKSALVATIESNTVKLTCIKHNEKLNKSLTKTRDFLNEGILNENFITLNINKVITALRESNVTFRWLFLHSSYPIVEFGNVKKQKQIIDLVNCEFGNKISDIYELMLNISQLELEVKEILKTIINEKNKRWNLLKKESNEQIIELSEIFAGTRPLSKIEKNDDLKIWFSKIANEIVTLDYENVKISGRKIIQLIQALEEVEEFHNLNSNMYVKQYLIETRKHLHNMIQTVNITEDILIKLQLIGDLSYAWQAIDINYTKIMQESIKKEPKLLMKLRALFLKLASTLEIPLLRLNQAQNEDLLTVSEYYSDELANYIRKVVQIIPETMFGILSEIIHLQTDVIKEIPTRLEKDKLKEYAQFDERFKIAKLTHSIAIFTEGILTMKKTLVGIIELNPKQLLEDGIRKELVNNLSKSLHLLLIFDPKRKGLDLDSKLIELTKVVNGYRRSFEYVQDYLNIRGLKIWQEEFTRIINFNAEQECNNYLRNKIQEWQSTYQSTKIPIPYYPPDISDTGSNNFIGRLAKTLLYYTDPKTAIYIDIKGAWYDRKTHKKLINACLFVKIREAIGPAGLVGLNKLYALMFITELQENIEKIQKSITNDKMWLDMLSLLTKELEKHTIIPNANKFYFNYTNKWCKVWPKLLNFILSIGHKQIIRQNIANELNSNCKYNAKGLESSLRILNQALITDIKANNLDDSNPCPSNELLHELNIHLEWAGIYDPIKQIFTITKNSHYISLFLFLLTISQATKFTYIKNIQCLIGKKHNEQIDGMPLIIGIITILQQFHENITELYLDYLAQYVNSVVSFNLSNKEDLCIDVQMVYRFLEAFLLKKNIQWTELEKRIPEAVLSQFIF